MAHHDPIGLIAPKAGLAQLNERSREIFRQIVESYLATGEPAGSRNISRLITIPLSPASVRNVMSDLEQLGLIYAPHTSAGRLPTELGLRFFVDALMQVGDLSEPERQSIQNQLASVGKAQTVEAALTNLAADWLQQAGIEVPRTPQGKPAVPLEISPLFALDAEEFASRVDRGTRINGPTYFS